MGNFLLNFYPIDIVLSISMHNVICIGVVPSVVIGVLFKAFSDPTITMQKQCLTNLISNKQQVSLMVMVQVLVTTR